MRNNTKHKIGFMIAGLLLVSFVIMPQLSSAEIIDVHIKGFDDGVKSTKQQDYKEAVLFAKREAIERAGVEMQSMTTVKDFVVNSDTIESKAEAVLMPDYKVVDIGYQQDGTYLVVLSGRIKTKATSQKASVPGANPGLAALASSPEDYTFYIGDNYGYHDITDIYFTSDGKFVINYTYKHGQIILTGVGQDTMPLHGTFKTDESSGKVTLAFEADGTAEGTWKTFITGGAIKIEQK